jgi:hypothetical protein
MLVVMVILAAQVGCSGPTEYGQWQPELDWQKFEWSGVLAYCAAPATIRIQPDRVTFNGWLEVQITEAAIGHIRGEWYDSLQARTHTFRIQFSQYERVMEGTVFWYPGLDCVEYPFMARAVCEASAPRP